ncbi:MAG TPA: helix-hairpin-helix domain-containing protein [Tepidisphaeraceae bacterium]|jgi:competence protein ComEA|nr:helix-hairpin-helix domain-containing protein [Tepidisphaeraceae bacterium]
MPEPDDHSLPFTLRQRRAVLGIFSLVSIYLIFLSIRDRRYVPDPLPAESSLASQLADRIDPNTADIATLSALPGLGEKRAAVIIAFREKVQQREPGTTVFNSPYDLLKVRGIGIAMLANLQPYLIFPEPPATQPSR